MVDDRSEEQVLEACVALEVPCKNGYASVSNVEELPELEDARTRHKGILAQAPLGHAPRPLWSRPHVVGGIVMLTGLLLGSVAVAWAASPRLQRSLLGSAVVSKAAAEPEAYRCGVMEDDMEYKGELLTQLPHVENAGLCCSSCQESPRCRVWTWDKAAKTCDLRTLSPNGQVPKVPSMGLVSGLPFQWDKLGSIFCFALMQPHGYETDLIAMQYQKRWNLFACDEYAVYSNQSIQVAPGVTASIVDSDLKCATGGEFKTALNTEIFMAVWKKVIADERYKYNDWTVKVDPDCVFFPERLRVALAFHPDTYNGLYLNNCKFGLHGPIEIFSTKAVDAWAAGYKRCMDHFTKLCSGPCLWGEDMFVDQCLMKVLNVHRDDDWNLLSEPHCDSEDWEQCDNHRIAFHPFKNESGYRECVRKADFGALPMLT